MNDVLNENEQALTFVPEVQVGHDHFAGGNRDSLVCVTVDDIDVFVAFRRQDHGKLTAVFAENGVVVEVHPSVGLGHHQRVAAVGKGVTNGHQRVILMPGFPR